MLQQLQAQLLACEKRAQHAAAAQAAALLRAQAAETRSTASDSALHDAAAASRKCMDGMRTVEGRFGTVNGKLDELSSRLNFAGTKMNQIRSLFNACHACVQRPHLLTFCV